MVINKQGFLNHRDSFCCSRWVFGRKCCLHLVSTCVSSNPIKVVNFQEACFHPVIARALMWKCAQIYFPVLHVNKCAQTICLHVPVHILFHIIKPDRSIQVYPFLIEFFGVVTACWILSSFPTLQERHGDCSTKRQIVTSLDLGLSFFPSHISPTRNNTLDDDDPISTFRQSSMQTSGVFYRSSDCAMVRGFVTRETRLLWTTHQKSSHMGGSSTVKAGTLWGVLHGSDPKVTG